MSATHSWFGAGAVNGRSTRSGRVSGPVPGIVVRGPSPGGSRAAQRRSSAVDGAAGHPVALPVQLGVDLPGAVDAVVLGVHPRDHLGRRRVA